MTSAPRHARVPNTPWRTFEEPKEPAPVSFGATLGGLAIAVGLGVLGAYMLDLHGHTCDRCGLRWRHFGAFNLGDEKSHTCSRCGEVQWWKCGAPHVIRGSQFVSSPTVPAAPSMLPASEMPPSAALASATYTAPAALAAPGASAMPAAFPFAFPAPLAPPVALGHAPPSASLSAQARRRLR